MVSREHVLSWLESYERAWRAPGAEPLREIFSEDASYQLAPYEKPIAGLDAIASMWEREREGPDEQFTMTSEIVAVDGEIAVARVEVHYAWSAAAGVPRPVDRALRRRRALRRLRRVAVLAGSGADRAGRSRLNPRTLSDLSGEPRDRRALESVPSRGAQHRTWNLVELRRTTGCDISLHR